MKVVVKKMFRYSFAVNKQRILKVNEIVEINANDFEMLKDAKMIEKYENKMVQASENKTVKRRKK